jgi:hypothetical protein
MSADTQNPQVHVHTPTQNIHMHAHDHVPARARTQIPWNQIFSKMRVGGGLSHRHTKYAKYTEFLECKILQTIYTQYYGSFLHTKQFINAVVPVSERTEVIHRMMPHQQQTFKYRAIRYGNEYEW